MIHKFVYVSDVPWWCIARHGAALSNYLPFNWEHVTMDNLSHVEENKIYVIGSLPIYHTLIKNGFCFNRKKLFVTLASKRDTQMQVLVGKKLQTVKVDARGFIINDYRFLTEVNAPVVVRPDRVEGAIFNLKPRKKKKGRLVVGWAGSEQVWQEEKNLLILRQVEKKLSDRIEVRWQRREIEGLKTAQEMADWYHSIDLYICLNAENTPNSVPVLEALACGTPVLTTRCGTIWKHIYQYNPKWVLESSLVNVAYRLLEFEIKSIQNWLIFCRRLRQTTLCNNREEMIDFTNKLESLL